MPTINLSCSPCCGAPPCPPDNCPWSKLHFFDKTGDCTCLPDGPLSSGPELSWATLSCPGNTVYHLECDEDTGQWVLRVFGCPDATLISYDPCTEIIFQLPDMTPSCNGTAKARITP